MRAKIHNCSITKYMALLKFIIAYGTIRTLCWYCKYRTVKTETAKITSKLTDKWQGTETAGTALCFAVPTPH